VRGSTLWRTLYGPAIRRYGSEKLQHQHLLLEICIWTRYVVGGEALSARVVATSFSRISCSRARFLGLRIRSANLNRSDPSKISVRSGRGRGIHVVDIRLVLHYRRGSSSSSSFAVRNLKCGIVGLIRRCGLGRAVDVVVWL
jgi:hypothetical protein